MMRNKVVLVTGAGSGIGRASALAFATAGVNVAVSDVNRSAADETVELITAAGGSAVCIVADVSRATDVERMVAQTVAHFGQLDYAHNNAGIESELALTAEGDEADFDRTLAVNLKGVWLCMRAEIRHMLKHGGGAIVNTSSVGGMVGLPGAGAYSAAKHGVIGVSRTAALEYAQHNIRVNAICPGLTRTAMVERLDRLEPGRHEAVMPPLGRMASPEEIAAVVVFLCSPAASFITGHALPVDGGYMAT